MTPRRHAARVAVALAALAVLAAVAALPGRGDDDGDAGRGPSATVAEADAPFCDAFGALMIAGPLTDVDADLRAPVNLEAAVVVTEELLAALVEAAPPEVAGSARALAAEYIVGFEVLARYGYDFARVDAEATPEDAAVLDSFLQAPAGPGADPVDELEDVFLDRCAPGVTVPTELLTTTTAGAATSP